MKTENFDEFMKFARRAEAAYKELKRLRSEVKEILSLNNEIKFKIECVKGVNQTLTFSIDISNSSNRDFVAKVYKTRMNELEQEIRDMKVPDMETGGEEIRV